MTRLLDDQPARIAADKLQFDRLLDVIDREVLSRPAAEPFVVGLFGRWGSGKSSLLKMLGERLHRQRQLPTGNSRPMARRLGSDFRPPKCLAFLLPPVSCHSPRYIQRTVPLWVVVEFSPWTYRQEKNLLIPLLACLAKQEPVVERLVKALIKSGPDLIKTIGEMGSEFAKDFGLPLLGFLQSLNKKGGEPKDLVEQIAAAVSNITGEDRKIVFLIDDLDRCHDPAQIVSLLEQIKLFLHLPRCLFFIAADRGQIVQAIETRFPGEGRRYLEKFVQLAIDLPQPDTADLFRLLPKDSAEYRDHLLDAAEAVGHNPRKLKSLWNRAQIGLELMKTDADRTEQLKHEPSLPLMLHWLLLQEAGLFQENPFGFVEVEVLLKNIDRSSPDHRRRLRDKLRAGGTKPSPEMKGTIPATPSLENLELYLWRRDDYFRSPRILAWYAKSAGASFPRSRSWLEQRYYQGHTDFSELIFLAEDFSDIRLHGVRFRKVEFWDCQFRRADLSRSDLQQATFRNCDLTQARLDGCGISGIEFDEQCLGLENLNTEPLSYQNLLDTVFNVSGT